MVAYYVFAILVLTFDIPFVYRVTGMLESIVFSHFTYFFCVICGYVLFYSLKLKVKVSTLFRLSILSLIVLSAYVMFFYSQMTSLVMLLPMFIIRGIGVSFFALGYHASFLDGLKDKQRDKFYLRFLSIYTLLPVFLPVLGGYIIDNISFPFAPTNVFLPNGYFPLFLVGAIIGLLLLVFSPEVDLYEDFRSGIKEPLKFFFTKELRAVRNFQIYDSYATATRNTVYGLLGFLILTNEFNLGAFSSVIAVFGSIYFLFIHKLRKKYHIHRIGFYKIGAFSDVLSQIFLLFNPAFVGLIVRSLVTTLISPLKRVFGDNIVRRNYDFYSEELGVSKPNFILFQEVSYFIGRALSFLTIMGFLTFVTNDIQMIFKVFIIFFVFLDSFEYFFLKKINIHK
jgi:MFS family permease